MCLGKNIPDMKNKVQTPFDGTSVVCLNTYTYSIEAQMAGTE